MDNDKIKIFISSSMNQEPGLRWLSVRETLKKILESNNLLRVFEIENKSAAERPEDFFLKQVANSNLVIILIGSVVRTGTYAEYQKAKELGKPILAYFDKTLSNLDNIDVSDSKIKMNAAEFKNQIRVENARTYSEMDLLRFDGHNILEDTLDEIRSRFVIDTEDESKYSKTLEPNANNIGVSDTLSLFKANKDSLYNVLFQKEVDFEKGKFGLKAIDWLLKGSDLPSTEEYRTFVQSENGIENLLSITSERWESFQNNIDGNYELAATIEDDVLQKLDRGDLGAPDWLVDDVLIDCRNLYSRANKYEKSINIQKRIENNSDVLVYPVLDRFKSEALQDLNNEMQKYSLQSSDTMNFGTSLPVIIGKLQDYFFVALIFGSATHIKGTRQLLADVIWKYGFEFSDSYLAMQAIRLYFLNGQVDIGIKLLKKHGQFLMPLISQEIDDLFAIFYSKYCVDSISGELKFIKEWGQQVSQKNFRKEVRFIYSILESNDDINTFGVGAAVAVIAGRLSANQIIELTGLIMDKGNPIDLGYIPYILTSHDLDQYVIQDYIDNVSRLVAITPNKLDFGDMSLLAPGIRNLGNQEKILNSIKGHSSLMTFKLRLLLDDEEFSEDYLVELKSILVEEIDSFRKDEISLGGGGSIGCLNPAIIGFELSQANINQSADVLMELLERSMRGKNISIVLGILDVIVNLIEKIYLEGFKAPKCLNKISEMTLSDSIKKATNIATFSNAYTAMDNLLTIIKKILANDDSVWLDAYADVNKYTVKACLLTVERDMREDQYNRGYLRVWLKSKDKEISIESIPAAVHLLFCEEDTSILESVLELCSSEYIEVRAKILTILTQYKKYNKEKSFRQVVETFKQDKDWRIRNMASEMLLE